MIQLEYFDKTYVDLSFKTRFKRQYEQNRKIVGICKKRISIFLNKIRILCFYAGRVLGRLKIRSRKTKEFYKQDLWQASANYASTTRSLTERGKEDLTVDGYISKYGAIESNADGKLHYNKASYMDSLKRANLTIKDW